MEHLRVRSNGHCEGTHHTLVHIKRVESLSRQGRGAGGESEDPTSRHLRDVDTILHNDPVDVGCWGRGPGQRYGGGADRGQYHTTWGTSRS